MLFADAMYVGIDPSAGARPLHYAALGSDGEVLALDQGTREEVLAFVAGLDSAIVAIAGPQGPNKGSMQQQGLRRRYNLSLETRTWYTWRVAEYELRRHNIRLYNTPEVVADAPRWVQTSMELCRRMLQIGFQPAVLGSPMSRRMFIEISPHACFSALLERRPFTKRTLEGRMQRQLVLYLEGLDLVNPLHALEEITRHRLLTGDLPLADLRESEELDALVGALTAWRLGTNQEQVCQVGEHGEGLITLPVTELKESYP